MLPFVLLCTILRIVSSEFCIFHGDDFCMESVFIFHENKNGVEAIQHRKGFTYSML